MKRGIRILSAAALACALSACGGGNGAKLTTKDQAAQAAFGAYNSGSQAQSGAALLTLMDRATASVGAKVSCRNNNGSVTVSLVVDTTQQTANLSYQFAFDGCEAGDYKNAKGQLEPVDLDGVVTYTIATSSGTSGSSVQITLNGAVDYSGGIDDTVTMNNLTLDVEATTTSASITLSGSIKTNESSFTYSGDAFTITPGTFSGTESTSGSSTTQVAGNP